jgi:hypothetical protein
MSGSWFSKFINKKRRKHTRALATGKQKSPKEAEKQSPHHREAADQPGSATPIEKGLRYTGPPFEESGEQKRSTPISRIIGLVILSLFLIVVLVLTVGIIYTPDIAFGGFSFRQKESPPPPVVNQTVQERIPIEISFTPYLSNPQNYSRQVIALKGFLKRAIPLGATSGVYTEYLTDDHGNDIRLNGLMTSQMALFPKKGVSTDLFLVNGTFKWFNNSQEPSISVIYIVPTNRSFTIRELPATGNTTG